MALILYVVQYLMNQVIILIWLVRIEKTFLVKRLFFSWITGSEYWMKLHHTEAEAPLHMCRLPVIPEWKVFTHFVFGKFDKILC